MLSSLLVGFAAMLGTMVIHGFVVHTIVMEMRRDLQRGYEDAKDSLGDWADDAKDRVREVGDRVRDVASRGAEIADDLRERAEPLRRVIKRS